MTRIVAAVLLFLYSCLVFQLTLEPPSSGAWAFSLADRLATEVSAGRLDWSETEVLANVALFVPAGFLLAIVVGRTWLAIFLAVLGSVLIETGQLLYLPTRVSSLADVQHNGLGAIIGALCAWPFLLLLRRPAPVRRDVVPEPPSVGAPAPASA